MSTDLWITLSIITFLVIMGLVMWATEDKDAE